MMRSRLLSWAVVGFAMAFSFAGCSSDTTSSESTGSLNLNLEIADGIVINEVEWTISGGEMEPMSGTINTSAPGATASVEVFGLPPGDDYLVTLEATDESGEVSCRGDAEFEVETGVATDVMVFLNCKLPTTLGGVRVNGKFNICAELAKVVVSPLQTSVGNEIELSAQSVDVEDDPVAILWSGSGGTIADASANETTYTCAEVGDQSITVSVSDDGFEDCTHSWTVAVSCVEGDGGTGGTGGTGGGAGGAGGDGGMGGAPMGEASVTAAHFAPEIPTPEDTAVAIYVNGEEVSSLGTLEYGETTGRVPLPAPATYDIGIGLPGGDGPLLELQGVMLEDGDDIAAAAYRTNDELPVALFAYNLSTDGLQSGEGRVFVSHGANAPALDPVDIILTDDGACPPPLLDDLEFGETRTDEGIDLPAGPYNLGFDLAPGDCEAEVPFSAPVTANVTSILVAVDEDTGEGLAPQVWALVDAETVVALISPDLCADVECESTACVDSACNPDTGLCEDTPINEGGDCNGGTGTCDDSGMCIDKCQGVVCEEIECNDNACNPLTGECLAMPADDGSECDGGAGVCDAGECVPTREACLYEQDFESLTPGDPPQAQPTSLAADGWVVGANVFAPDGTTFLYNYFAFPAPNGGPAFSAVAVGEGGAEQGEQQLSVYNDYNNADHGVGNIIEAIVFRERTIEASDVGKTLLFTFDAKKGNIEGSTTAAAFIKTIDAGGGTTNAIFEDTTNLPDTWGTFTLSLPVDAGLVGQTLQIGAQSRATNFEGSGIFYDNMSLGVEGCGGDGGGGGGDIAINGGFETGAFNDGSPNASWQQFPNGGEQAIVTDNPSEGTYAANLSIPARQAGDPGVDNLIKNANLAAGDLTPGQPITITWDMRGSLEGAGGVVFVELFSEFAGGGATNEIYTGGPIFPTADWESFTWDTTLGADVSGGVTLQLKVGCGAVPGCGADVYFDNVTIVVP